MPFEFKKRIQRILSAEEQAGKEKNRIWGGKK